MTFVDTSGLIALLDGHELRHADCAEAWKALLSEDERLLTTNYVLVESFALVQRRLGLDAVQVLCGDFLPLLRVVWMDQATHQAAVGALLTAARRRLSLVDCASFEIMRRHDVAKAFTLDAHFAEQGFVGVPGGLLGAETPVTLQGDDR